MSAEFTVAVVPSDDPQLTQPLARDAEPDAAQIEAMVRRAVGLSGGLADVVPDTARLVVLKPNIVTATGRGIITDPRVARAVALLVHEVAPQARILFAEGAGGWTVPELVGTVSVSLDIDPWVLSNQNLVDGFETSGYRAVAADLRDLGIDVRCYDLNFDRPRYSRVPGGGMSRDEYAVASVILDADAWIDLPVAKTHGSKITVAMKNQFGLLPGHVYGWSKARGTRSHEGIPHAPRVIDETFVDLMLITEPDFVVVDMIAGSEGGAFERAFRRANIVLAGRDPVACDLVAGKLMGFNPDDLEFAELAARRGHGPGRYDNVTIAGAEVAPLVSRWVKAGRNYSGEWSEHADYGKGPRRWTFLGPLPRERELSDEELRSVSPTPGSGRWSAPVWFGHDRIDLERQFGDDAAAVYAFTRFTMPRDDDVRFWIGADERLQAWIDGELVYETEVRRRVGRRSGHRLGQFRVPGQLIAGDHDLLIRVEQRRGAFEFSFNICEPIDDVRFAGNTYPGLRYHLPASAGQESVVAAEHRWSDDGRAQTETFTPDFDPAEIPDTAPDSLVMTPAPAPTTAPMIEAAVTALGLDRPASLVASLVDLPFGMTPIGVDAVLDESLDLDPDYGPPIAVRAGWIGFDYWITHGRSPEESRPFLRSLMARDQVTFRGARSGFVSLGGYREEEGVFEILLMMPDGPLWETAEWWWDTSFDGQRLWCPVATVRPVEAPIPSVALVDTMALLALEMARLPYLSQSDRDRGQVLFPAGLAAWDAAVIDWERQPLTRAWAEHLRQRQLLGRLARAHLRPLAAARLRAAELFAWGAAQSTGARKALLQRAHVGYWETAVLLTQLAERLPVTAWGPLGLQDLRRLDELAAARPLLAMARDAERGALSALAELLRQPPLPPVRADPLRGPGERRQVLTVSAEGGTGLHFIAVDGDSVAVQTIDADDTRRVQTSLLAPLPREDGWRVELERRRGNGAYRILEQPGATNGWRLELRVQDRSRVWSRDGTEIHLWAVRGG